jgi:hypothetical protein
MYNKTIIRFGFRMTSRIIQTSVIVIRLSFASANNIDLGLNNSWCHAQPHPIVVYNNKYNNSSNNNNNNNNDLFNKIHEVTLILLKLHTRILA